MLLKEIESKRILWSALNWGFGHVYRSIPLIKQLLNQQNEVVIACDFNQKEIFSRYLANEAIVFEEISGYNFQFSTNKSLVSANLLQLPSLLKAHFQDRKQAKKIADKHQINLIVSDHRYGFAVKNIPSIFLTHQVRLPINSFGINWSHQKLIARNFTQIWILDNENGRLAGKLSTNDIKSIPSDYIGLSSRFTKIDTQNSNKIVAIISGPKVYAAELLKAVSSFATRNSVVIHCVTALEVADPNLIKVSTEVQDGVIQSASQIISHCGYSTLMDLVALQLQSVILIPSPNQHEQEYLADFHQNHPHWKILQDYQQLASYRISYIY